VGVNQGGRGEGRAVLSPQIYLDYGGFVPVDPRVHAVMRPYLEGWVGNPSSQHALGAEAKESLEASRKKVARMLGGLPPGVVFTSGATEANNLAIKGAAIRDQDRGRHLVVSSIEHISVLNPCRDLQKHGWSVTWLPVDREGMVDPDDLRRAIRSDTVLVSVMAANYEIGTVEPTQALARVCREHGVAFHVDGVGAVGRVPFDADAWGVDLVTLSGNDLYGPPGVGGLYVRPGFKLAPMILGGGQEEGLRSGTENLPAIVGMGVAAEFLRREATGEIARLVRLRDRLLGWLLDNIEGIRLTGSLTERLPHHVSVCLTAIKGESVVFDLDLNGIVASTGSACASKTLEPSHVLKAIGCAAEEIEGSLCFTLGRWTRSSDIEAVLQILPLTVARLRAISPLPVRASHQ
jgi:cysteine desulfurase